MAIQIYEGSEHCRNKYITSIGSLSYVEKLSDNHGSSAVIRWISLWLHVYVSTFMNTLDLRKKIFSIDLNRCMWFYWKKICWFFFILLYIFRCNKHAELIRDSVMKVMSVDKVCLPFLDFSFHHSNLLFSNAWQWFS